MTPAKTIDEKMRDYDMAQALCRKCNPEEITRLRHVRTILNPEEIMVFYCPRCRTEFHEHQVIWSNFTWLYEEEAKEW